MYELPCWRVSPGSLKWMSKENTNKCSCMVETLNLKTVRVAVRTEVRGSILYWFTQKESQFGQQFSICLMMNIRKGALYYVSIIDNFLP